MRKICVFLFVTCFLVSIFASLGFAQIDFYKFKQKRTDQGLEGNRGYIMGKPSNIPEKKRKSERELIGVDVELSRYILGKDEDEDLETSSGRQEETRGDDKISAKVFEVKKDGTMNEWLK